jgi:hypothetical protein
MPTQTRSFVATTAPSAAGGSAAPLFQDLLALVAGVGPGKSLENKVQQALHDYLAQDVTASCSELSGLLHELAAQNGKKIDPVTASLIIGTTDTLRSAIGC